MDPNDRRLVDALLAGEPAAAAELEQWVSRAAVPFRGRLGGDWEDAVKEARAEILAALRSGGLGGDGSLRDRMFQATCRTCLERLRRRRPASVDGSHPAASQIAALAWGTLDAETIRTTDPHVQSCADCREELAFATATRSLTAGGTRSRSLPLPLPTARPPTRSPLPLWLVAAAVALVIAGAVGGMVAGNRRAQQLEVERDELGASLSVARGEAQQAQAASERALAAEQRAAELESRLEALLTPDAGLPILELRSLSATRGEEDLGVAVLERGSRPFVLLRLVLEAPESGSEYEIHLLGSTGEVLWSAAGARVDAAGALAVLMPVDALQPGLVVFEVAGGAFGEGRQRSTYRLLVRS